MARLSSEHFREQNTPKPNLFKKMFWSSRKSGGKSSNLSTPPPGAQIAVTSPTSNKGHNDLKEGFAKVGLFPSDRVAFEDMTRGADEGNFTIVCDDGEEEKEERERVNGSSQRAKARPTRHRETVSETDSIAAQNGGQTSGELMAVGRFWDKDDSRVTDDTDSGADQSSSPKDRGLSLHSTWELANELTQPKDSRVESRTSASVLGPDPESPSVMEQDVKLNEHNLDQVPSVFEDNNSKIQTEAVVKVHKQMLGPNWEAMNEALINCFKHRPETINIGPYQISDPKFVLAIQNGLTMLYLGVLFCMAFSGPGALFCLLWRTSLFMISYLLIMRRLGYMESTGSDALLEPLHSGIVALVKRAIEGIVFLIGYYVLGPLIAGYEDFLLDRRE